MAMSLLLVIGQLGLLGAVTSLPALPDAVAEGFTELPLSSLEPDTEAPAQPPEPGCAPCSPSSLANCPDSALDCKAGAGLVQDPCGCCPRGVCGLPEGARCYNASTERDRAARALGTCGDDMDCLMRHDLSETDKPEALCVCRDAGPVCGSDNTTYPSMCQLRPDRISPKQDEPPVRVWLKHRGPCRAAPWVVTPPAPVEYHLGSPVSLECEVKGYPTPATSWQRIGKDGMVTSLPGDDAEVVVLVRGGPEPFMATTWLQIMALRRQDAATYLCVATSSEGVARAATRVTIS